MSAGAASPARTSSRTSARGAAPALRIGIDARAAAEDTGGRGRVVRELLREFALRPEPHRYRLYARTEAPPPGGLDERFEWRCVEGDEPGWQVRAARQAARECDVFLAANTYVMAALLPIPTLPVVHDVLPLRRSLGRGAGSWMAEAGALAAIARRAANFVVVSRSAAAALERRHPGVRGRVTVALLGVSPALEDPTGTLPAGAGRDFVLAVASSERRKNLARLAEAHRALPAALREAHPLVIAGPVSSPGQGAIALGRVADSELGPLYRECAALCFPSLNEGFGLPVAEAMAAGAPVVTSPRGSLPEVAGEAAVYVEPESVASITRGLERVLGDAGLRAELSRRGRARAATLTWDRTAKVVLGALEGAAVRA